jgi:hypothetical protein
MSDSDPTCPTLGLQRPAVDTRTGNRKAIPRVDSRSDQQSRRVGSQNRPIVNPVVLAALPLHAREPARSFILPGQVLCAHTPHAHNDHEPAWGITLIVIPWHVDDQPRRKIQPAEKDWGLTAVLDDNCHRGGRRISLAPPSSLRAP